MLIEKLAHRDIVSKIWRHLFLYVSFNIKSELYPICSGFPVVIWFCPQSSIICIHGQGRLLSGRGPSRPQNLASRSCWLENQLSSSYPSTSFCSLSSWYTPSCAYRLRALLLSHHVNTFPFPFKPVLLSGHWRLFVFLFLYFCSGYVC